jgi:hypothetical protein
MVGACEPSAQVAIGDAESRDPAQYDHGDAEGVGVAAT